MGSFVETAAHDLGATVIKEVLHRAKIDNCQDVDEVILGQVGTVKSKK